MSIGLAPMLHPPGSGIYAFLNFVSNGPRNKKEALVFCASSFSIDVGLQFFGSMDIDRSSCIHILQLSEQLNSNIDIVSNILGTLLNLEGVDAKILAAIIGNAAFLAPDMFTSPEIVFPPVIIYC